MKRFSRLYARLDETTRTSLKLSALESYFREAPGEDAAWAVYFLSGRRLKRLVPSAVLREQARAMAGIPEWLFEESYTTVGDLAETIALLAPCEGPGLEEGLAEVVSRHLLPLAGLEPERQGGRLGALWERMDRVQLFVFGKLLTGAFRVGVSRRLVTRALAAASGLEPAAVAHRLMGHWEPSGEFFRRLTSPETGDTDRSRPYPFFLAHPLEGEPASLGPIEQWQLEWKWDGIRAQLVRRGGQCYLWSRGEELVTERFPEIAEAAARLPEGTVLDGEILPWKEGGVLPFAQLQRRIGRKKLGPKILSDVPAILLAYDLLESSGDDTRELPLSRRRAQLETLLPDERPDTRLQLSPLARADGWDEADRLRLASRSRGVEGLMLKRHDSPYRVGRTRGDWWKWKVDPYTLDAVLIYAQRGHGRRATLYTDYTFAVWDEGRLVPVAKAYSGLTDEEIREVDRFVRGHTLERFGPVRAVQPRLVFELAFENLQRSGRHKSGVALRFPRMARWRRDKAAEEADTLENVKTLLRQQEAHHGR